MSMSSNNPAEVGFKETSGWTTEGQDRVLFWDCGKFYIEVTSPPYPGHIGKCLWTSVDKNHKNMEDLEKGECILHYLTRESEGPYKKMAVGVSKVAKKPIKLTKEELITRLEKLGIWNNKYAVFASRWLNDPKNKLFYFVELTDYVEFKEKITFEELSKLAGITSGKLQRYLVEITPDQARKNT